MSSERVTKQVVINDLQKLLDKNEFRTKGTKAYIQYLIHYMQALDVSYCEQFDFWEIDRPLSQIFVKAWEEMRTSEEVHAAEARRLYEEEVGHGMSSIVWFESRGSTGPVLDIGMIKNILELLNYYEFLPTQFEAYAQAPWKSLCLVFGEFLRVAYTPHLFAAIKKAPQRGMTAQYGDVYLRTYVMAGRVMFTFAKTREQAVGEEESVSFVAGDDDPNGLDAGLQSVHTSFGRAVCMMQEVIDVWMANPKECLKAFKANSKVMLDVMSAMEASNK